MNYMQEWLEKAPKPWTLKAGQKWHVFLSYRSIHRPWVIELYDTLRSLKYEVFLDQYVLAANDDLVTRLSDALRQSASGVLILSAATADSEWCRRELSAMINRETQDKSFHCVIAKLDHVDVADLVSGKLWQDFSDRREGPSGAALLRLLYGLSAQPMSPEALTFTEKVDEEVRDALIAIKGAREIGDGDELLRLAKSLTPAWTSSALLHCLVAEVLIGLKRVDEAIAVIDPVVLAFPRSTRPKQLKGLALRRKGDWKGAQSVLSKLTAAGEMDPETMGIFAATWMERYLTDKNELHLKKSRDLYVQAFLNAPQDYYVGINAASKSILLGDIEAGRSYAETVEQLVGVDPKPGNYWMTATVAEVQLLKGEYAKAHSLYENAVVIEPDSISSHETTWKQACRLMDKMETSETDRAIVAKAFRHLGP